MLQIHGTNDEIVPYGGGTPLASQLLRMPLPVLAVTSAKVTAERWAARNGCGQKKDGGKFDLESSIAGQETTIDRYDCPTTAGVELWSITGAPHVPKFFIRDAPGFPAPPGNDPSFPERIYDWLNAHPKS
jgi:poly(3-hydroxybutyrate) depolymerase